MKYFGYPHDKEVEFKIRSTVSHPDPVIINDQDEFVSLVFAPDPETGNPSSSLAVYAKSQNPEIRNLIREKFFIDRGSGNNGIDDPDLAIDTVKLRSMSDMEYLDRIRDIVERENAK